MIVLGFGKSTYKDRGPGESAKCPMCGNHGRFLLMEERTWFSLFFVPLIPYRHRYVQCCSSCEFKMSVSETEFESAILAAQADRAYLISPR